jgi:hypothetical protein
MATFEKRRIDLRFTLGRGSFGAAGEDALELNGYRVSATIDKAGGASMSRLDLRVWGVPLDAMNKLTILGTGIAQNARQNNTVTVSAGDERNGSAVVFFGNIIECWVDTREAPNVALVVMASTGYVDNLKPVPPTSYKGVVDAAVVMAGIAAQMSPPVPLENTGVQVKLTNPYYPGTLRQQALDCAREGQFNLFFDDRVLAIWPRGGSRGGLIPDIGPKTGMVGYPTHTQGGIQFTTLYNPSIVFGGRVRIRSVLTPAIGDTWVPAVVTHELESEIPGGKWFTTAQCLLIDQEAYIGR